MDVVAAQVEPEAPVRRAVGPRTGLRLAGILGKPIATVVIFVGGVGSLNARSPWIATIDSIRLLVV